MVLCIFTNFIENVDSNSHPFFVHLAYAIININRKSLGWGGGKGENYVSGYDPGGL